MTEVNRAVPDTDTSNVYSRGHPEGEEVPKVPIVMVIIGLIDAATI